MQKQIIELVCSNASNVPVLKYHYICIETDNTTVLIQRWLLMMHSEPALVKNFLSESNSLVTALAENNTIHVRRPRTNEPGEGAAQTMKTSKKTSVSRTLEINKVTLNGECKRQKKSKNINNVRNRIKRARCCGERDLERLFELLDNL